MNIYTFNADPLVHEIKVVAPDEKAAYKLAWNSLDDGMKNSVIILDCLDEKPFSVMEVFELLQRLANLNPNAGEIGAGMLASLVDDARKIIG